jgi:hypothetical protein
VDSEKPDTKRSPLEIVPEMIVWAAADPEVVLVAPVPVAPEYWANITSHFPEAPALIVMEDALAVAWISHIWRPGVPEPCEIETGFAHVFPPLSVTIVTARPVVLFLMQAIMTASWPARIEAAPERDKVIADPEDV